jgi:RNA polymerase sigma-70 factor (ECF subfamily)
MASSTSSESGSDSVLRFLTADDKRAEDKKQFVSSLAVQHGRRLRRFLLARLKNAADVPDLAQEVFLRLLRIPSHDSIRTPEAYLLTIASHVVHQHALRQAERPQAADLLDAIASSEEPTTPDPSCWLDARQNLERILAELPDNVRACLILQRLYGYSLDEIVAEVGIARSTVKKYLVRALLHCEHRQNPPE